MTPYYVVQQLCNKTESGEIEWKYNDNTGHLAAVTGGVNLLLHTVYVGKSAMTAAPALRLEISSGVKETHIDAPQIHISAAPGGKTLRFFGSSRGFEPENPEEREKEDLRISLERLNLLARKQCREREEPEAQEAIKQELFGRLVL